MSDTYPTKTIKIKLASADCADMKMVRRANMGPETELLSKDHTYRDNHSCAKMLKVISV